jgi:hypothetical protein
VNDAVPLPVLLNTWKHHAGWIRWRIGEAVQLGRAGVDALPREMAIVGARLMDLYTGEHTPAAITSQVIELLDRSGHLHFEELAAWLAQQGEYSVIELQDSSKWTIRLGPKDGRYLHLHPSRWSPWTMRVQANTLKSAVMAIATARLTGAAATDLALVNEARRKYLGLGPVRELSEDFGLGAVLAAMS